jgi:biotin transport system substrate-specific component
MTTSSASVAVITARVFDRTRATSVVLVTGFALFTALMAQIEIPLWFTPVPITGQTLAVVLAGAALGSRLGAASQALYVGLGALGLPFYSGGEGGWSVVSGATGGYLVGFVFAAALVGFLAERGQDRTVVTALPAFLAGTVVVYACGVTWLAASLDVSAVEAMELGLTPFVIGDLVKVGVAGLLLPTAWRLIGPRRAG